MKRKYFLPVFLLFQILLVKILAFFPGFIENYYSRGLYPVLSRSFRFLLGWIPFSVGDLLYFLLIFFILKWIWKSRQGFFTNWKANGLTILRFLSVLYFLFHVLWGFNYYRTPLHEKLQIDKEYSYQQLLQLTHQLVVKTNALQKQIEKDTTKAVFYAYSEAEMYALAPKGYNKLTTRFPDFKYSNSSIKSSLLSLPLSYMGFGGYLNPFTNEAQVNDRKPKYTSPLTISHEMGHQMGIASESECNFIGFMAAISHDDLYFQYSAYSFALNYCLYNLEMMKEGSSLSFKSLINKGVLQNFKESKRFWQQHQTPINDFFEYFYDHFLKLNQQKDGMESYSKFVGLLLNYNLKKQVI
ncbi:Probable transmembrane protein of unknown function [Flavobacterium indicum GPTSA100-9 = DSM 17447]|uniref:Amino acid permease n=1 Tax=Flavobacterium indicum (strain DSM 17447 / CIP 109464 / GPTSA100-9) TaxID=1094466 RepID=H8XV82_FLAIG|nr:Probable transmembrane protein of unknown function [Flavobacterium indicum GPTSA100-9 = DSM 17447]